MPLDKKPKSRKSFDYEYTYIQSQIENFEIHDYVQNPPMIKKLYEERELAHAHSSTLEDNLNKERYSKHKLELQKKEADIKLEEALRINEEQKNIIQQLEKDLRQIQTEKHNLEIRLTEANGIINENSRYSLLQFFISLIATIIVAIGVNLITSSSPNWISWLFIVLGVVFSSLAFFVAKRKK